MTRKSLMTAARAPGGWFCRSYRPEDQVLDIHDLGVRARLCATRAASFGRNL